MALVVHVEPVVHGMIFELGYVPGDIDNRHSVNPTRPVARGSGRGVLVARMARLPVCRRMCSRSCTTWPRRGRQPGGSRGLGAGGHPRRPVPQRPGRRSGRSGGHRPGRAGGPVGGVRACTPSERPVWVVLDPVDGSTNASRGLPWWATSACAIDADGPAGGGGGQPGDRQAASRPAGVAAPGATAGPSPRPPASRCARPSSALSGYPEALAGLDPVPGPRRRGPGPVCRGGRADRRVHRLRAGQSLAPWDYLGGSSICQEAGAVVQEAFGRDLVVAGARARRTPVAAATPELLAEAVARRVDRSGSHAGWAVNAGMTVLLTAGRRPAIQRK